MKNYNTEISDEVLFTTALLHLPAAPYGFRDYVTDNPYGLRSITKGASDYRGAAIRTLHELAPTRDGQSKRFVRFVRWQAAHGLTAIKVKRQLAPR